MGPKKSGKVSKDKIKKEGVVGMKPVLISHSKLQIKGKFTGRLRVVVEDIQKKESDKVKDGSGFYYRFIFSNGKAQTMGAIAFGKYGESLAKQLEEDKVYLLKGNISVQERKEEFISEAISKLELKLNDKVLVIPEKRSTLKSFKGLTVEKVIQRIKKEEDFIATMNNATIQTGKVHRYLGCEKCKISIRTPNFTDGKFYCLKSKSEPCKSQPGITQRKLFMIIKNLTIKDYTDEDILHELIMYDAQCKTLMDKDPSDFGDDNEVQVAFDELKGSTVNLKLNIKKNFKNSYNMVVDYIKVIERKSTHSNGNGVKDEDDAEPLDDEKSFESKGEPMDTLSPTPEQIPNLEEPEVTVRVTSDTIMVDQRLVYETNSNPQALVLLINNYNFRNEHGYPDNSSTRKGSEVDVINISTTFTKLGCEIFEHGFLDVEDKDVKEIIKRFKAALIERKISSLFVILMSHGNTLEIHMTNGRLINFWTEIIYQFNNVNFPEFIGKPKIFIIQCCQSFPKSNHSHQLKPADGTNSDFLIALPNAPGYTSKRNKNGGSWFIYHLMKVFREKACSMEIQEMLKEVQILLRDHSVKKRATTKKSSGTQNSQVNTWMSYIFDKFYFTKVAQFNQSMNSIEF